MIDEETRKKLLALAQKWRDKTCYGGSGDDAYAFAEGQELGLMTAADDLETFLGEL